MEVYKTMKTYKCECPECKAMNENLLLDETDGWFDYTYYYKVPRLELSQVAEYMRMSANG